MNKMRIALLGLAVFFPIFIKVIFNPFDVVAIEVIYGFILPSAPFICLAILVSPDNRKSVVGSMVGAIVAICIPYLLLTYDMLTHFRGGADIGLGLLLMAMPVYLLLAMSIGWNIHRS